MKASGKIPNWWKTKMPSFRSETLESLARAVAVLERVEQLRGLDGAALGKSAGLGILMAVDRPVVEESALGAS